MRILFVNHKAGFYGGVEQNVAHTSKGLLNKGHECFLAYGSHSDIQQEYVDSFTGHMLCNEIHSENKATGTKFQQIIETFKPDIIYLHKLDSIDCCLPWLGRLPIIRMMHDHDLCCPRRHKYFVHNNRVCHQPAGWRCYADLAFLEPKHSKSGGIKFTSIGNKLKEMQQNKKLDRIIVGSQFMYDELNMNGFDSDRISVLPPCVPNKKINTSQLPENKQLLYVGQLIHGKGVDLLLNALTHVTENFSCTIAGTGNAEQSLKTLAKSIGLSERVNFAGWISNASLTKYYNNARIAVVPSRWPEPFGMVGLEAMLHGRPVVAFDVGGIHDWLQHDKNGILIPEQDVKKMGQAINTLLSDDSLTARLAKGAAETVLTRFNFKNYIDELESLFCVAMKQNPVQQ